MKRSRLGAALAACLSLSSVPALAEDDLYKPEVAAASPEASEAIRSIRLAPGLRIELFAAEPLLANPVAFCIDDRGRFYVAETFRLHSGVTDNRGHMNWLDADMASRTVADRVAMYRKYLGAEEFARYQVEHERVRMIVDADGDGKADRATVFADGFKDAADGIGAGLLARKGDVYYTCIPDLWRLRDTNNDGKADLKQSLSTGYGVHVAFLGHDLHGLKLGPDGRLYFSVGDRGLNVTTPEGKHLLAPDTGSVLRCEPDGSDLEIFATGLRNPQELAFDDHGNLFTCDNNSDGGDRARWVHVVQGGDSGWRMGYQYLDFPTSRGPWNAEKLWHPLWDGQAAYIVPPLLNIADGPSGLTHDPGTGLPARYRDHFFLADFRGGAGNSGVRSFANKPRGASFELVDAQEFAWSVLATDVDFGPDGAVYVSDWVNGWNKTGKGRIWKITPQEVDPRVAEVKAILAEGMGKRPVEELDRLLGHADQRVRLEAQYELADRTIAELNTEMAALGRKDFQPKKPPVTPALDVLIGGSLRPEPRMARLHAIWGLSHATRRTGLGMAGFLDLARDPDEEVRAQAYKAVADQPRKALLFEDRVQGLRFPSLLAEKSPRVRFFAALAIGKWGDRKAMGDLLGMLRENEDKDAYLRHAAVMALVGIGDVEGLKQAAADPSPSVRIGAVLALRRLGRPEVAAFLADKDPKVATEAGLAIYEAPIPDALPGLAKLASRKGLTEALARRAINAANRVGRVEDASALASVAGRSDASKDLRVESLAILAAWANPPGRDRINGLWRPIEVRPARVAADALRPAVKGLIDEAPDEVRRAAIKAVGELKIAEVGPVLAALVIGGKGSAAARAEAIQALEHLGDPMLGEAVQAAARSTDGAVRSEGLRVLARLNPEQAIPALVKVLAEGTAPERQKALAILGTSDRPEADVLLARALDRQVGKPDHAIELELIEAASKRKSPEVASRLARWRQGRSKDGPAADYHEALEGGDPDRGRKIYTDNAAVYCVRCHKIKGEGGEVGPELTGVGGRHPRNYLLESIVAPNQAIAQGFESVIVARNDGTVVTGVFKAEDEKALRLMTAEARLIEVPKADIEERKRGASAMPDDLHKKLTKAELRDLVEFLATLK
jgi:quinoprotein glucose dehydrogenase